MACEWKPQTCIKKRNSKTVCCCCMLQTDGTVLLVITKCRWIVWQICQCWKQAILVFSGRNLSLKLNKLPVLTLSVAPPSASTLALVGYGRYEVRSNPFIMVGLVSWSHWCTKKVLRLSEYLDNETKSHHNARNTQGGPISSEDFSVNHCSRTEPLQYQTRLAKPQPNHLYTVLTASQGRSNCVQSSATPLLSNAVKVVSYGSIDIICIHLPQPVGMFVAQNGSRIHNSFSFLLVFANWCKFGHLQSSSH